jgi:hypothetical protein
MPLGRIIARRAAYGLAVSNENVKGGSQTPALLLRMRAGEAGAGAGGDASGAAERAIIRLVAGDIHL